jgi:hypothetical protein
MRHDVIHTRLQSREHANCWMKRKVQVSQTRVASAPQTTDVDDVSGRRESTREEES